MARYIPSLGHKSFLEHPDTPNSFSGKQYRVLVVNKDENKLEFVGPKYFISNDIYHSDDAEESGGGGFWQKIKEFTLPSDFPANTSVRLYWEWCMSAGAIKAYCHIRSAGVIKTDTYETTSTSYISVTVEVSFGPNDTIEWWGSTDNEPYTVKVRNFRILGYYPTTKTAYEKYNIQTTG